MAYRQGRDTHSGPYNNSQTAPGMRSYYGAPAPPQPAGHPYVRRAPSFDTGDDAQRLSDASGNHQEHRVHGLGVSEGTLHEELTNNPRSPPLLPPRTTSYGPADSERYQRRDAPLAAQNTRGYNPQQYGLPQTQYSPPTINSAASTFTPAHQAYNPAAYHQASNQYQPNFGYPPNPSYHSVAQPPQPPPRPSDYNNHTSPLDQRPQYPMSGGGQNPYRQQPLPPHPHTSSASTGQTYTPPAPPPLPLREPYPSSPSSLASSQTHSGTSPRPELAHHSSSRSPSLYTQLSPLLDYSSTGSPRIPSPAVHRRPVATNNSLPPTPGTPGPPPPQHSPQRTDTISRHPQARPLPGPPTDSSRESDYFSVSNGHGNNPEKFDGGSGYEDLMQEVEAAVMGRPPPSSSRRSPRAARAPVNASIEESPAPQNVFTNKPYPDAQHDYEDRRVNGHFAQISEGQYVDYDAYGNRSDAEAEAGAAALHMADEQDAAEDARRRSGSSTQRRSQGRRQSSGYFNNITESSSDSDIHVDMDSYGGGFPGHVHYGSQDLSQGYTHNGDTRSRPFATARSSQRSDASGATFNHEGGLYTYQMPGEADYIHPFAPARVDTGGTGGLSEPGVHPRRLSFEDGDEAALVESEEFYNSGEQGLPRQPMPDMFFHPGSGRSRPLPAAPVGNPNSRTVPQLMPAGTYRDPEKLLNYDQYGRPTFPVAPDSYNHYLTPSGTPVPRSSSLISHGSTPQAFQPIRSKTDADRARILRQQQQPGTRSASIYGSDHLVDPSNPSAEILGLPSIPAGKRGKFNPSKLSTNDFKKCSEPWALSSIVAWLREMSEGEADLKEHAIVDGIVALFTHKVPTMNTADAETLGAKVVQAMFDSGTLLKEEEWVKFGLGSMCGVLFQLTGTGCYSPKVHTKPLPGRCYAHHCMRTLKKINLQAEVLEPQRKVEDWVTFYKIEKSAIENVDKKEIERQNILHEIVTTEDAYMDQLNVLRVLYRDELVKHQPPIISLKRRDEFVRMVFSKADAIKQVNEDYLLPQLKYRQQEQGPWIVGFSDIFREWIRKAKTAYVEYAASFPNATLMIRQEVERNILFRQFLDQIRENERSKRLGWDTYLKAPITRLQRYSLLLSTVYKNMKTESEEKKNLATAIEEVKVVTLECDARVAEMTKNVDLTELATKLILRSHMANVQLNLTHLGREIIYKGDLQRMGANRFFWLDCFVILFDHYLVLAKTISQRDAAGGLKYEKYDVSKMPIPMDLLVLESTNDDPVVKSTVKGIGSVTTVTTRAGVPTESRMARHSMSNSSGDVGTMTHTNTSSSAASIQTNGSSRTLITSTVLDSPKDEKIMYPFRVRHLGRTEVYVLYAPTQQNRHDWCMKIVEAKTRHAASLYSQNAEPFRLRVVADTAFAYDSMTGLGKSVVIKGTPLDRAVREVEKTFQGAGPRPNPVCRAAVNCATAFSPPSGTPMIAIGTDYGVYISDYNNPRGWTRVIAATRVTQLAILEEFSVLLILADKTLIAHHLDTILPHASSTTTGNISESSSRRAPQKLSGARDIGFFAHGRMKDRHLIFYKKRDGISSTFKVLEPVYQKSTVTTGLCLRSRLVGGGVKKGGGTAEFFRDFDDFYIPSETYALNLFHSSLAIATTRGIEVMTLDKKLPFSIPDLKPPACAPIASRLRDQKPLGMFRLSESEFLLVFEEIGIYVNKHGDVSRAVVMEYVARAKQACLIGGMYLVLVDHQGGFVEVRNAINGRLRQVVSGRDVRLLDDGGERNGGGGDGKMMGGGGEGDGEDLYAASGVGAASDCVGDDC